MQEKIEKFPESALAHKYLDGLKGVEIGGSSWNRFGLDTINVDINPEGFHPYMNCEPMKVDVVAPGDNIPLADKSFDFVISSHVLEHFYDPIRALKEWKRIARKYIFIIVPHKERTFDKDKPLTPLKELIVRHMSEKEDPKENNHWSVWNTETFMDLMRWMNFNVVKLQDPDDKVGNGITVLIELDTYCIDCGKELLDGTSKRCPECLNNIYFSTK